MPKGGDIGTGQILEMGGNAVGSLLQPLAKVGFSVMDGVLPPSKSSPLAMVNSMIADVAKLGYPPMETHVAEQTTGLDGYVVSQSIGKSLSFNKGESSSRSVGMNAGLSLSVTPLGVGVGANAGVNLGTSTSQSVGAGGGTSRSQSMSVGFFGPTEAPAFRVGMLVARLRCGDRTLYAPIGTSNVLVLDGPLAGCTSLEFFINDDLEGSKASVCGAQRVAPCARGTYTVEVQPYSDTKQVFKALQTIFASDDFQAVISSSVVSSDPIGSAWRIFDNMAKGQGLDAGAMRPVVEQYVTRAKDEFLLKQAVLELEKLETETQKISISARQHARTKEILTDQQGSMNDIDLLRKSIRGLIVSRIDVNGYLVRHYASRLKFWLDIYRASIDYHSPSKSRTEIDNFYSIIMKMLADLDSDTIDFASISESKDAAFAKDSPGNGSIYEILTNIKTELTDKAFMDNLSNKDDLRHCVVDLTDIGYSPAGLEAAKSRALSRDAAPAVTAQSINYIPFTWKSADGKDAPRPLSAELEKVRTEIVSSLNQGQLTGVYELEVHTDPGRLNDSIENLSGRLPVANLPFREPVAFCSHPDAGAAKVVGIAVTYSPKAIPPATDLVVAPRGNTVALHDPLMIAQASSGAKFYRFLDRAWTPVFVGGNGTPFTAGTSEFQTFTTLINMKTDNDIQQVCKTLNKASDYATIECFRKILGESVDKNSILASGISRSFFNSYVGGTWRIYLPDHPDWKNFYTATRRAYFHMFMRKTVSIAP